MRVRVKICGITRMEDALASVDAGADALGFMFHEKSARFVTPSRARSIISMLPPFVTPVGVFVDTPPDVVRAVARETGIAVAQLHGDESAEAGDACGLPYVKAISVCGPVDAVKLERDFPRASAVLLDHARGGTGTTFDWRHWPSAKNVRLILAGGLTVDNVAAAIAATRPFAVDVSTGVEAAPGIKDASKVRAFIAEVARASQGR